MATLKPRGQEAVGPYRIHQTAAVVSSDHTNAHLIAVTFTARGIETPQGSRVTHDRRPLSINLPTFASLFRQLVLQIPDGLQSTYLLDSF